MTVKKKIYTGRNIVSAIFMALTLAWLTVSIPFVNAAQIKQAAHAKTHQGNNDNYNPFANTTEEKAPSSVNISEEFLHHHEELIHLDAAKPDHSHSRSFDVYVAFHGELLSPPPEA